MIPRRRRRVGTILQQCEQVIDIPSLEPFAVAPICSVPLGPLLMNNSFLPIADNSFQFFGELTINPNQIAFNETLLDFVATIHLTLGPNIIERVDGFDVELYDTAGVLLDFDRLFVDNVTGEVWMKVRVPSAKSSTKIQIIAGKSSAIDRSNKSGVWNSNFSMVMELDKLDGGVFKDSTSNANDSLAPVNTTIVPSQINNGIFGQANEFVDIPNDSSLDPGTGDFFCMIWTNANDVTQRDAPIGKNSGSSQFQGWSILFSPAGFDDMVSVLLKATNNNQIGIVAQKILSDGVNHHIAFSWQPNNIPPEPKLRVFVGGDEPPPGVFASDTLVPGDVISELNDLSIGSAGAPFHNNGWVGTTDDVIIGNTIPPKFAAFVKSYYNTTVSPEKFWSFTGMFDKTLGDVLITDDGVNISA